jgi:hypothetical protein
MKGTPTVARILSLVFLCAGTLLSGTALADNICTHDVHDPQLSFPGTNKGDVFGVMPDSNGDGGFGLYMCSPGDLNISWLTSYSFGDFNHDGFEDLMFGRNSNSGGQIKLFLNDKTGSGTVVLSASLPTGAGAAPVAIDALDLDGDGWDDILTANGSDGTFSVLLNDGSGAFPAVKQYTAGSDVAMLVAMDVNGDGFPDVITASTVDQTISVFINDGDGTFAPATTYHLGGPVGSFSVADLNGDGHPDIYVTSVAELNIFAPAPPSSTAGGTQKLLNKGDGTFTVSAWQPYSSASSGGSLSISGVVLTASTGGLALLTGDTGSVPPIESGSISVTSGIGKITAPTAVKVTVTKSSGASSGNSGSSASGTSASSGGGGEMELFSLALLGLAGLLRRKRA